MSHSSNSTAQERLSHLKKLGNTPEAIAQLKELLKEEAKFIPGWMELGRIYRRRGDRQLALSTFPEALKFAPHHQRLNLELATEQLCLNQFENCRQTLQDIFKVNSKDPSALLRLGELYRKQDNRSEALKVFQKTLELHPNNIWAQIHTAIEFKYARRFEESENILQKSLENNPNHFNVLMLLGEVEQNRQNLDKAFNYFKQASKNHSNKIQPELKIAIISGFFA